jgi:aminoglycoside phosphotransferase (APT) family kinase protein
VAGVVALAGGTSSAVHAVDVRDGGDTVRRLVLRRFVRADRLAEEPGVPRREAAALRMARACPLPTPELVAFDPDGGGAGEPALLMTRLPGAIRWQPADLDAFLERLAAVLRVLHATRVPPGAALPDYAPYARNAHRPPSWSAHPEAWRRGFEVVDGPVPAGERSLVHRDYHPGNVLWADGAVSGIVDWAGASIGSPDADVGHCRMNLVTEIGLDAADRFLALHRRLTGRGEYDPYWDIAAALGGFDQDDVEHRSRRDEEFLARAVARL